MRWIVRIALSLLVLALAMTGAGWWLVRATGAEEPELPGTFSLETLEHEGRERSSWVYRPARVAKHPALVLVFHGSVGDGLRARGGFGYGFDVLAEEHGFLVAYPNGYERHWNGCRKAGPYQANLQDVDDVGFAARLIDHFAERDGVDRRRVFATGISNGGHMTLRLALESPRRFRAFAPVIASLPTGGNMGCEPAGRPVSILMLNGTEDPMNPYAGGKVALYGVWGDRGDVLSSEEMLAYWGELAGHRGEPERELLPDLEPDDGSRIERIGWSANGRPPVWLYAVIGGGHTVPHPDLEMPRIIGRTNHDVSAAELLWRFFDSAPVPRERRGVHQARDPSTSAASLLVRTSSRRSWAQAGLHRSAAAPRSRNEERSGG